MHQINGHFISILKPAKGARTRSAALVFATLSFLGSSGLFTGSLAHAQFIHFGVKAGVPVTDYFETGAGDHQEFNSSTNRYTVGPTIELSLPHGLSFELDALYKRFHFSGTAMGVDVFQQEKTTANSFEFPLLLKYRFGSAFLHPFVDSGLSLQRLGQVKQLSTIQVFPLPPMSMSTDHPAELDNRFTAGFVLGAGMELKVPFIRVSPELRYTRWGSENFKSSTGLLDSNQNRVEFLVGFTF